MNYQCKVKKVDDVEVKEVGGIEGYDQFGPETWINSGRYTSINGQVLGEMPKAQAGAPERWRLIHAGVRDTINLEIRPELRQRRSRRLRVRTITPGSARIAANGCLISWWRRTG